nr:MAG TPA: hypothetical protein [Caudoviricetes sp.]
MTIVMEISGIKNERSCWSCACACCVKGFNSRNTCEKGACHGDPSSPSCHFTTLVTGAGRQCYVAPDSSSGNIWHT